MTEPLEIQVFTMFPLAVGSADWKWVHYLTFPIDTLDKLRFTPKPYKWIRYAIGVAVGAHGHLSSSPDFPLTTVDYDIDLPSETTKLFYHIGDAERGHIFPVDPNMGRTHITSGAGTPRRDDLRTNVVERDETCVLTGFDAISCEAVHLLPHSKGDDYIGTYTERRVQHPSDIVDEIDHVRNAILLNPVAHIHFGENIAFLVTPNFAMDTKDIDPTASPTENRCTAHVFVPGKSQYLGDSTLRSGCPVRMPDSADDWPPDILFDAVYACAVLRHFAPSTLGGTLDEWKTVFYPGGIMNAAPASHQAIVKEQELQKERKADQDRARTWRATERAKKAGDGQVDFFDLLLMPYLMLPPSEVEAAWKEAEEKRTEKERSRIEDKVVGWAKEVANAGP